MNSKAQGIESVEARRLHPGTPAAAACFSLPVPPGTNSVAIAGAISQGVPIAWWNPQLLEQQGIALKTSSSGPTDAGCSRRQLITLVSEGDLPEKYAFGPPAEPGRTWDGPQWSVNIVDRFARGINYWEVGELVLRYRGNATALRLGLDSKTDGLLWWEWLRVEELWSGPACRAIRCTGYIPAGNLKKPEYPGNLSKAFWLTKLDVLHQDLWILGEMYILLFGNGVIQVTARHINNHLYNRQGNDLQGILPVCGIRGTVEREIPLIGATVEANLGQVRLNTEECRSLASPEHPGRLQAREGLTIFQPYESISIPLYSFKRPVQGRFCEADAGDPQKRLFPVGVARSFRFCLALGTAPARVERYVLPYWWYGLQAELTPQALLPVHDELDSAIDDSARFFINHQRTGCFDDGSVLRYHSCPESNWEGETPYNLLRYCYRNPDPEFWNSALRSVYNLADIGVDHIGFLMRMHGYDYYAISPTMNRSNGLLQGYLETGDPYLRETCENLALAASSLDSSNWPRRSYGRDAMYIRGLILLEDYLPGRGHGIRAREALGRLAQTLTREGCVCQQSGTVGIHAACNEAIDSWQNFHCLEPVMDWLERHPQDDELVAFFRKVCDWLVTHFVTQDNCGYWPSSFRNGDNECHAITGKKFPVDKNGFPMYAAKTMLFASRLFNDPKFLKTWQLCLAWLRSEGILPKPAGASGKTQGPAQSVISHDHAANKTCESLTWHQIHRWRARWVDGQVRTDPYALPDEKLRATIVTPAGLQEARK